VSTVTDTPSGADTPDTPDAPGGADTDGPAPDRPRGRGRWREPRIAVAAVVAVVALSLGGFLAWSGRSGDEDMPVLSMPTTTLDAGGIEVAAPDGWAAIPVPQMGFGLAVPNGWEATILDPEVLASLDRSTPAVPGFVEAAHGAAESGAVLYGAGADGEDRVTDLKVRAATRTGVTDAAGLEDYARDLAAEANLPEAAIAVVEGAERPTVRTTFTSEATSAEGEAVPITGSETLVLGPKGVVWSLIVTSEVPEVGASLGPRIADTFTLADAPAD
jgi:hypothetical protein